METGVTCSVERFITQSYVLNQVGVVCECVAWARARVSTLEIVGL